MLFGIAQINLLLDKHVKKVRDDVAVLAEIAKNAQLESLQPVFVGAIARCQGFENIGNAHDPRLDGHFIRGAVSLDSLCHPSVRDVRLRILARAQVLGPGQRLNILIVATTVVIDDFPLGLR